MSDKPKYQLRDSPFFRLRSRRKLAKLLRCSVTTLRALSRQHDLYVRRWKHKSEEIWLKKPPFESDAGTYRPIDIPDERLKKMQSRIADLLSRIAPPSFLFSPVKGRSYVENAAYHIDGRAFRLLDVEEYFPSCTAGKVGRFFHLDLECSKDVTAVLVCLTTFDGCLPQGSPCSPILAYYCNQHTWLAVAGCVEAAGCKFSLYMDDITISGPMVRGELIWNIKRIIHGSGLRLKSTKETSLIIAPADITGVIVKNGKTYLPNRQHKRLAELKVRHSRTRDPKQRDKLRSQIVGRLAQRRQVENPKPLEPGDPSEV